MDNRISRALEVAEEDGTTGGAHHKMWVIDQMVRELTGCPTVTKEAIDGNKKKYFYDSLGESKEYTDWVIKYSAGDDGPNTYAWDTGVAP